MERKMYVYLKDVKQIHYMYKNAYVIRKDGNIVEANEECCLILKEVCLNNNKLSDIIRNIRNSGQLDMQERLECVVEQTVAEYSNIFKISLGFEDFETKNILQTGEYGKSYPMLVQIALTNKCLHHCKHCYANASISGNEIKIKHLEELLDYLTDKCSNIEFTGGEPFLYGGLKKLLDKYSDKFSLSITTSGNFDEYYEEYYLSKFNLIQVSLYGASEEEHDRFVGVNGSYRNALEFIHRVQTCENTDLIVQTQARSGNIIEMEKFVKNCIQEKINLIKIGEISPVGRGEQIKNIADYNRKNIQSNVNILKRKYMNKIDIIYDNEHVNNELKIFTCGAGKIKWHITSDGKILPCALFSENIFSMGNIDDRDYKKIIEKNMGETFLQELYCSREKIEEIYRRKNICVEDICENM